MKARGVFAEDAIMRVNPPAGGDGAAPRAGRRASGGGGAAPITDAQKAEIRLALNTYLKPYLLA
jgi:hypothetical protein